MKNRIKAWLKRNVFAAGEPNYTAVIESFGSITPSGIISKMAAEGMEFKPETVLDVVTRYNRKSIELTLSGYNVNTGLVMMRPVVKGIFHDKTWNPERNHVYVSVRQGTDLRTAIAGTTVDIRGEQPNPLAFFSVKNIFTGRADGILTRGFNAELKGSFIKIAGDNSDCGIYFHKPETAVEIKLETQYITVNDPSRILIIVPATMEAGKYDLRITTQYTCSNKLLKHPRSINLQHKVEIV